jgi:hypothetical protein
VDAAGTFVSIETLWVSHSGLLAYVASISDDIGIIAGWSEAHNPMTAPDRVIPVFRQHRDH